MVFIYIYYFLLLLSNLYNANSAKLAVVIDAGSTGSRAHVFEWKFDSSACGGLGAVELLLPERSSKIRPGFATYLEDMMLKTTTTIADVAGNDLHFFVENYLELLRSEIDKFVAPEERYETQLWFLGTAGLRSLTSNEQDIVLQAVRAVIVKTWEYKSRNEWIEILSGDLEGIYSWALLNQLLNRRIVDDQEQAFVVTPKQDEGSYHHPSVSVEMAAPVALIEFGGASAQVVARPPMAIVKKLESEKKVFADSSSAVARLPNHPDFLSLSFCGNEAILYAKSFQGYGRQLALQTFLEKVGGTAIADRVPCLPSDTLFPKFEPNAATAALEDIGRQLTNEELASIKFEGLLGQKNGTFAQCRQAVIDSLFASDQQWKPIPFKIEADVEVAGNENMYHFHKLVATPQEPKSAFLSINWFRERSEVLCSFATVQEILQQLHPKAELEKAKTGCFGLTFMAEFLERIVGLEHNRTLVALRKIAGVEVSWPAGYILVELPALLREIPNALKRQREHDEL